MSGMLAGVEAARWRRLHKGGGGNSHSHHAHGGFTRRSGYCLYATSHDNTIFISAAAASSSSSSSSSSSRRYLYGGGIGMKEEDKEEKDQTLGQMARKAKQRLEQRLMLRDDRHHHHPPKSQSKSTKRKITFFWPEKLGGTRKSSDHPQRQKYCPICLDSFMDGIGENLVKLPCAHRFHSRCLLPCLDARSDCPCCRMPIFSHSLNYIS